MNECENIYTLIVVLAVPVSKCAGCANIHTASASPASRCVYGVRMYTYMNI